MNSPITQRHIDFARAAVKLAREHGMDHLAMQFRMSFSAERIDGVISSGTMRMHWTEGRHGDSANIRIECETGATFPEVPHG